MLPLSHVGFTAAAVKLLEASLQFRQIDYRILLISSLLPDLFDKSLGKVLGNTSWIVYESRAFGHSLVFVGLIGIIMAIHWLWDKDTWLLPVFLGTLFHDAFDVMWIHPGIFFWPVEGWQFPAPTNEAWIGKFRLGWYQIEQRELFDKISLLILLYFFMKIGLKGNMIEFMKKGKM